MSQRSQSPVNFYENLRKPHKRRREQSNHEKSKTRTKSSERRTSSLAEVPAIVYRGDWPLPMAYQDYRSHRVVWREGSLLCQQHLQQQARHFRDLNTKTLEICHSYPWGLREIEISAHGLSQSTLDIQSFRAVMPDGLFIDSKQGDPLPELRDFSEQMQSFDRTLMVYVGVPNIRIGTSNFDERESTLFESNQQNRFGVAWVDVYDDTRERESNEIEVAIPRCRIFFEREPRDGYSCIPIARIKRAKDRLILDPDYVAPSVCLPGAPELIRRSQALISAIRQHYDRLLELRRRPSKDSLDIQLSDTELYLWLSALGSSHAELSTTVRCPTASTFELFRTLYSIVGRLTPLAPSMDLLGNLDYKHLELEDSFGPLFARVYKLLDATLAQRYLCMPMQRRSDGIWLGELENEMRTRTHEFVLALASDFPPEEVMLNVPRLSKLASAAEIGDLVNQATSGAHITPMYKPPASIPMRPDTSYFRIDTEDPFWHRAIREGQIGFYVGEPFNANGLKIQLMVPKS